MTAAPEAPALAVPACWDVFRRAQAAEWPDRSRRDIGRAQWDLYADLTAHQYAIDNEHGDEELSRLAGRAGAAARKLAGLLDAAEGAAR